MTWHFSDGTVAHLGGTIDGGTSFAQELRHLLDDPKQMVQVKPIPDEATPLDRDDPALFDLFLRSEMNRPCNKWMMLRLLKAPKIPALDRSSKPETYSGPMLY
jgi:hypothetical protein